MIKESRIVRGCFFYEDNVLVGEMYITEMSGIRQFHARNYGAHSIRSFRSAVRFLTGEKLVYSGCHRSKGNIIRVLKMLGFKEAYEKDNLVILKLEGLC